MSPEQFVIFATPLPEPLCLINAAGQILAFNPAMTHFFEIDSHSLAEKSLFELTTENEKKIEAVLRIWSRSREMIPGSLKIRLSNQQILSCNCRGGLIQPKNDHMPALLLLRFEHRKEFGKSFTALNDKIASLQKEIKERQRTERVLAQRNAEFEAIVRSITDTVIFADTQRRIIMSNPAVSAMFGYTDDELIGNTTAMLYADDEAYRDQGKRRYRTGENTEKGIYEIKYQRKDGSTFWAETMGTQVRTADGEAIGYVGLIRDITKRRQINKELTQHRNHLEGMVVERTEALTAINKELEAFSYSVSHDLMAPLRAIDGFSEILLEDYAAHIDDDGKNYLQRMRNNAQQMGTLIYGLLSLSRMTQSELTRETVDLSNMVQTTVNKLQEYEPQRKITLNIEQGLQTWADKRLLEIALDNLLGNAWKYTAKEPKAQITFGAKTKNDKTIYHVRDNGVGFDMQYANKLFEAFQRLHSAEDFEGTGIGLATVARILHRHNGRIWAEAEVGQGAAFYFTLGAQIS